MCAGSLYPVYQPVYSRLHRPFYTVRAGIPMDDALVQVSLLLKCAAESAYELSDYGVKQSGLLWACMRWKPPRAWRMR